MCFKNKINKIARILIKKKLLIEMGNSTSFKEIEKKYDQDGIDYVAFRYHERRNYHKIKDLINMLKDHAHVQKQDVLEFIDQEKRLL